MLGKYPDLSIDEIKQRIIDSSDKLPALQGKVDGGNKINCGNSVFDEEAGSGEDGGSEEPYVPDLRQLST